MFANLEGVLLAEEFQSIGLVLTSKAARIGGYLAERREETWAFDVVPNLLLVERLRASLDRIVEEVTGELLDEGALAAIRRALHDMDRVLLPLIKRVGETPRALLEGLIARHAAPSPFCVGESRD